MKVLVTGGAGYVGSHAVRALVRAGHEVAILDNFSTGSRDVAGLLGCPVLEVDLRDHLGVEAALAGRSFDAVAHFAALASVPECSAYPELAWEVNFCGGLVLLEAMRRAGVDRLVTSSTAAVYGESCFSPIREGSPKAPPTTYGQTKLAFELVLEREARGFELRWLALRYFNAAGASDGGDLGELHTPETHLIPRLLTAAREGSPFPVFGADYPTRDGTCLRDYVHVEDLARAHVLALEQVERSHGLSLNLGTGTGSTVLEVVRTAERVLGRRVEVERRPRREGDSPSLVADPSLAWELLGWKAKRTLEDAVRSQDRFCQR